MKIPEQLQPFLLHLVNSLSEILETNLIGVYIHGSLTYGGYVRERSDIDLLVMLKIKISTETSKELDSLFKELSKKHPEEVKNIELDMLLVEDVKNRVDNLKSQYTFMDNSPKGLESLDGFWIELENTRENGMVLTGPNPDDIIPTIDQRVLIQANKQKFVDLQKNAHHWEEIDLWNQIFILVQASRVLYSLNNDLKLIAKQDALEWAINNTPDTFTDMLKVAQAKLDDYEGEREQVISDNWEDYLRYVDDQLKFSLSTV